MANTRKKRRRRQPQIYDTSFKSWITEKAQEIIPQLLPGATYEETLTIEVIRSTMRADKVFKIKYRGHYYILHIEFESGEDEDLRTRLLIYNAVLYRDYELPVISIVVYPFRVKMAESPLRTGTDEQEIITFHFHVLPFFTLEAERYIQEHVACMYPLLPTMKGANANLIKQAMDELAELYREDEVTLSQQFVWLQILLDRTDTVSELEKQEVYKKLSTYDKLWEENPRIQKMRAESKTQGAVEALQVAVVNIVKLRFPNLLDLAQKRVQQIQSLEKLDYLHQTVVSLQDENAVRQLLEILTA